MRLAIIAILVVATAGCTSGGRSPEPLPSATGTSAPVARSTSTLTASSPRASVIATGARLVRATTARSLDATGKPVDETSLFDSATDRTIVLAIDVTGATQATTVGYRRYFENTYIDGKNTHPTHPGDGTITFSWTKSASATFPAGGYLVHVLIDGRDVGIVRFAVR